MQYNVAGVVPAQGNNDYVLGSLAANNVDAPFTWRTDKLPQGFDLKMYEDYVKNQYSTNSCVGHGMASGGELFAGLRGTPFVLSPRYPYFNSREDLAKILNQPVADVGTSTFTAMAAATREGMCLEQWWSEYQDINTKPSEQAYADGRTRLIGRYERVGRNSWNWQTGEVIARDLVADLQVAIYCGMPVVFGIPVSYEFFGISGPMATHPEQWVRSWINNPNGPGNHCMLAIGWFRLPDGRLVIIVENSYGPGHGDGGFLGILASDIAGQAFDLFAIREFAGMRAEIPMSLYRWNAGSVEGQAARLYRAALGRYPEKDGLIYQANAIKTTDLETVASQFMASPEFQQRFGAPDDAAFIRLLYDNVLHREPAQSEVDWYLASGMTRVAMLIGFSESPENQSQ